MKELKEYRPLVDAEKLAENVKNADKLRKEWAASDAKRDQGLKEPENVKIIRNVSYGEDPVWNLLDVYIPEKKTIFTGKLPVVVNIHGGGYFYGDKDLYRFYCMNLALYGVAVVNFSYLLSPEYVFPAHLDCIDAVLEWIEKHAEEYDLDTDKVILIGDSAGAQMCTHMAAICTNDSFRELFGYEKHKLNIRGVIPACGMYHFNERKKTDPDNILTNYLGGKTSPDDPRLDVLAHIDSHFPPTFLFSSKDDFLRNACEPMEKFLKEKGVPVKSKIYGLDASQTVGHVFHVDMKSDIARMANDDQFAFIKECCL